MQAQPYRSSVKLRRLASHKYPKGLGTSVPLKTLTLGFLDLLESLCQGQKIPYRKSILKVIGVIVISLLANSSTVAQQINDPGFQFEVVDPTFPQGMGPNVCIDEAHHNVHTIDKLFAPFAQVLRSDGFQPKRFRGRLSRSALSDCKVLILGNGQANDMQSEKFWVYPHVSAYSRLELDSVVRWVRGGGSLLLFADHSPAAGSASGLAALFGVQLLDAWSNATPEGQQGHPEVFRRNTGGMSEHPILQGKTHNMQVNSVATYGSAAFFPSELIEPILTFVKGANARVYHDDLGQSLLEIPQAEWPTYSIEGWLMGGSREWGKGRVVMFGDVTACTAQLFGPEALAIGMNYSEDSQNHLFCLNMVRWLAGAL